MPTKSGSDSQKHKDDRDHPTRTRVSRACNKCRAKKDRCDGALPVCSSCANSGHRCTYDPSTKKRGLPEGYVRGLEKLWALAIQRIEGLEDVMTTLITGAGGSVDQPPGWGPLASPQSRQTELQTRDQGNGAEDVLKSWNDERLEEFLHDIWKESPVSRELERLLSTIESSEDKTVKRKRERDELDDQQLKARLSSPRQTQWKYSIIKKQANRYENGQLCRTPIVQKVSEHLGFLDAATSSFHESAPPPTKRMKSSPVLSNEISLHAFPQLMKLPSNSPQLLDLYFSHTHCWLPIIERHDILRVSYQYSENPKRPAAFVKGSGVHAALWAILAYTNTQYTFQEKDTSTMGEFSEHNPSSRDLYEVARNLIPSETEQAEVGHVQALILLTLINVGQGKWTSAWLLVGHAVRLAMDLGLAESPASSNRQAQGREKHVFLGCFVIDTLVSARLGRCTHLRREDAIRAGPVDEDGLEEWDLWFDSTDSLSSQPAPGQIPTRRSPTFALSTFNQAVELFGLLNDVVRDTSTDRGTFCALISQKLQLWHDSLPQVYQDDGATMTKLPHQVLLHLGYYTTLIALQFHSHPHRKAFENPDRRAPEVFAYLPSKICSLLKKQLELGRLTFLPPIYVYAASLSIQSATIGPDEFSLKSFSFTEWMQGTFECLSELENIWPVFAPLRETLMNQWQVGNENFLSSLGGPTQPSGFDTPLHNASNGFISAQRDIWIPNRTPDQTTFEPGIGLRSVTSRDSMATVTASSRTPRASQLGQILPPLSTPPESRNDGSPSKFASRKTYNTDLWAMQNVGTSSGMLNSSLDTNPQSNPLTSSTGNFDVDISGLEQVHTEMTDISAINHTLDDINFMTNDVDAIFRDLAHLDTTEWTNNREQGLKDFGFADDSTFRAFCNDPERLVTGNAFFQTSPSADLWPPQNGLEDGPDRHLEASQILHSLSSNDQFPMLSEQRLGW